MEGYRLKIKVGPHEFEAEGSEQSVSEQFKEWKQLIETVAALTSSPQGQGSGEAGEGDDGHESTPGELPSIFRLDRRRRLVSLAWHPTGDRREADALLLLIYGFARAFEQEDVAVTSLKEAMATSGSTCSPEISV